VPKDQDLGFSISRLARRGESKDDPEDCVEEGEQHRRILETARRRMNRVLVPLRLRASRGGPVDRRGNPDRAVTSSP
jgi:hypothetical protein